MLLSSFLFLPFSRVVVFFFHYIINFPAHICSHTLLQHFCNTPAHSYLFSLNTLTTTTSSCLNWDVQRIHAILASSLDLRQGVTQCPFPYAFSLLFPSYTERSQSLSLLLPPSSLAFQTQSVLHSLSTANTSRRRSSRGQRTSGGARAVGDDTPFHSTDGHKEKERKKRSK